MSVGRMGSPASTPSFVLANLQMEPRQVFGAIMSPRLAAHLAR